MCWCKHGVKDGSEPFFFILKLFQARRKEEFSGERCKAGGSEEAVKLFIS